MKINGSNLLSQAGGAWGGTGVSSTDAVSRNLQRQIERTKQQLQELSANDKLSLEEKMKKRQDLQKQLADLNNQLRQHQIELRRQEQQKNSESVDELIGNSDQKMTGRKREGVSVGISQEGMRALISADQAIAQADASGSVATRMEDRSGILETEIKMDKARGASTEQKEKELAGVNEAAQRAQSAQMGQLANAAHTMREVSGEETEEKDTEALDEEQTSGDEREEGLK